MRRLLFVISVLTLTFAHYGCDKNDDTTVQRQEEGLSPYVSDPEFNRKACNGGDLLGCTQLGDMKLNKGNLAEAELLYKKA